MKYVNKILKISIVLLLLLVCVGSIHASDSSQGILDDANNDVIGLNEDLDDLNADDLDDDSDWDDDEDDDLDDDSDWDDDEDDFDWDDDFDWNESEEYFDYTDFDYLKLKIIYYLDKYGNCSDYDWTETEEFLNEYQVYLLNASEYKLNESAEGYETYLKIFDSITSTFGDYNLTENETDYLKFMVIFYLNAYGNVSANYTWNDSESFSNFTLPRYILGYLLCDSAFGCASSLAPIDYLVFDSIADSIYSPAINNSTDFNQTATNNGHWDMQIPHYSEENLLILLLVFVVMIFVIV